MVGASSQIVPPIDAGTGLFFGEGTSFRDDNGFDVNDFEAIRAKKLQVLLIDDDDTLRDAFAFELGLAFGADVIDVKSGAAGVEIVAQGRKFDLIFLDIMMEEMNGIQTFHKLEPIKGNECSVVIMSAYSESDEWQDAKALDVELVSKPIPERKLISLLRKAGANR